MTRRGKAYAIGSSVALLLLIGIGVANAKDKPTAGCGEGMIKNPARARRRAQLVNQGVRGAALEAELAKLDMCVPATCPDGQHRDEATGLCVLNTPDDPDPGFDPFDPGTDDPITPGVFQDPNQPGGDIDDILKPYPEPGNFYQVKKGDIFFGTKVSGGASALSICYMALRRAAFLAAKLYGNNLSDSAALAVVNANASTLKHEGHSLRPYLDIIGCGWWNDENYASWKYAAGKATKAPTGRAISLNPAHAPNLAILRAGGAPARNVRLGTPAQQGTGSPTIANGSWRAYPLLWIPEIDLKVFWDSNFRTITTDGVTYDDGSSRANPPPWITIRKVDDATGTLEQGTVMGCAPSQGVFG